MAYSTSTAPGKVAQKNGSNGRTIWSYVSADGMVLVGAADYFSNGFDLGMQVGDIVVVTNSTTGATTVVNVTVVTTDGAASVSGATLEVTASGGVVVPPGVNILELNNVSAIAATIAITGLHAGLFVVSQTDAGTAGHTLTLTGGTFNPGGDTIATLNAALESLVVFFDDAGNGTVINNTGAVALS